MLAAQHTVSISIRDGASPEILDVTEKLVFTNTAPAVLPNIVLNDWNNAYATNQTPLAKRFSDEYARGYLLARAKDRGHTDILSITGTNGETLPWIRPSGHPDLIEILTPVPPGQNLEVSLSYELKLPDDRFTGYGYSAKNGYTIKDFLILPARLEDGRFARYSNLDLNDYAAAPCDISIEWLTTDKIASDLDVTDSPGKQLLTGNNRTSFTIYRRPENQFYTFTNTAATVQSNLQAKHVDDIRKALIVDRIVDFTDTRFGRYPFGHLTVSETDYQRDPFYGLSQLPSFLNVFPDDFIFELKFLKTYLNNYLKTAVKLDPRRDNWVFDALQVSAMMDYIDAYYPDVKTTGALSRLGILRRYHLFDLDFNKQYETVWLLMARKNLDQPLDFPKDKLIRFNAQIAGKYRAGMSLHYLDRYLGDSIVARATRRFVAASRHSVLSQHDFEKSITDSTDKNLRWFFDTVVGSRDVIDYSIDERKATADSVSIRLKNEGEAQVPIPVYGVKNKEIVFREWIDHPETDTVYTFRRNGADKIVLNYEGIVPEFNRKDNTRTLKPGHLNTPIRFMFFKDIEDPDVRRVLFVPTANYNLYDGLMPGLRIYNKTFLDKPFNYDLNPGYATLTKGFVGSGSVIYNQYLRHGSLYYARYILNGHYFHYTPDAAYLKVSPTIRLNFRDPDFRENRARSLMLRDVIVNRQPTTYTYTGDRRNYSIFDARWNDNESEAARSVGYTADLQASSNFGKAIFEGRFRKVFADNRAIDFRMYAGTFLYNHTTDDYFSFALDRPTDYLFDYDYYGRSESTGLFSQQIILAEGGFKSKLDVPFANQWITTVNGGVNIWNWIEAYADAGVMKNRRVDARFLYDSGIRLNLVPDYFELYFPVYSSNGWEFQDDYGKRIRFVVTLDPKILINLFTRKWF